MSSIENILLFHGLGNYIETCINEEIDLDVLKIFGELYLEKEIGLDSGDLESLKLFGESVPSNLNLGTLEEHLISLDVDPEDFGSWVVMTRGLHPL
jgi:hypothetical protein